MEIEQENIVNDITEMQLKVIAWSNNLYYYNYSCIKDKIDDGFYE